MKLQSTLPEQPGFLHAIPLLNVFALLLLFQVFGPAFMLQSGVTVEMPPSRFQMERFENPLVITVAAGEQPAIFVGHQLVPLDQLGRRLDEERERAEAGTRMAVLRIDSMVPAATERQIAELALARGYRVALAGRPGRGGTDSLPPAPQGQDRPEGSR